MKGVKEVGAGLAERLLADLRVKDGKGEKERG